MMGLSSLIGLGRFCRSRLSRRAGALCAGHSEILLGRPAERGAIAQCLKVPHQADLSDACKQRGEELKQKMQSFKAACRSDSDKFCKDVQPGGGRKIQCLKDNAWRTCLRTVKRRWRTSTRAAFDIQPCHNIPLGTPKPEAKKVGRGFLGVQPVDQLPQVAEMKPVKLEDDAVRDPGGLLSSGSDPEAAMVPLRADVFKSPRNQPL